MSYSGLEMNCCWCDQKLGLWGTIVANFPSKIKGFCSICNPLFHDYFINRNEKEAEKALSLRNKNDKVKE